MSQAGDVAQADALPDGDVYDWDSFSGNEIGTTKSRHRRRLW